MSELVSVHPTLHQVRYQLDTTKLIRQAAVSHPQQVIISRDTAGAWPTTSHAATRNRVARTALQIAGIPVSQVSAPGA
ncbi:hypothetical protein, partial [Actinomadura sp. BRA 177]|uniref:hypothetical protein n=1 Tax=Actinomadura sp. BRA 177 TaxID=2745202 RepID=UPI001C3E4E58